MSHLHNSTCGNSGHIPSQSWQMERLYPLSPDQAGLHTCHTNPPYKVPEFLYPNIHPRAVGEDRTDYAAVQKKLSEKEVFRYRNSGSIHRPSYLSRLWDAVLQAICKCLPCARSNRYLSNPDLHPAFEAVAITGNH